MRLRPRHLPLVASVLIGVLVTAGASWSAWRLDRNNERDLLAVQTKQAADVIGSAITGIAAPLQTAVAVATGTSGDAARFRNYVAPFTRPGGLFVTASLWRVDAGGGLTALARVGRTPLESPAAGDRSLASTALHSSTFAVQPRITDRIERISYALASAPGRGPRYLVYAEREIPASRRVAVEGDRAFADLKFATYLGAATPADLSTTNVDPKRLPLTGTTAQASIPFGNATLTLIASPARHLGGQLSARLWWIFLVAGLVLTAAAAAATGQLVQRRLAAEEDAETISGLYRQLDRLYDEQRSVSTTLQHALLPQSNPKLPGVDFAAAYVAGEEGVEIGGDWYSVIDLGDGRFGFVVGDVSGRGVDAAVVMGRIRFTLRAYLLEGHPPHVALGMASRDLDIVRDGHLVTVLIGVGDPVSRRVVLASAGHLSPLVAAEAGTEFVAVTPGPPLGVGFTEYRPTEVDVEPGALLLAFTDGLVERRGEDIDAGLGRLLAGVRRPAGPLQEWLTTMLPGQLGGQPAADDIAVLAIRWAVTSTAAAEPATFAAPLRD